MAFKKTKAAAAAPDSPDLLMPDLPQRTITGLLDYQTQMLQQYAKEQNGKKDIALQLPTGSGKTVVGLLIAEWRRRKFGEKVVYLCPNNQLVHQVKEQALEKYGLMTVTAFTGSRAQYPPADKTNYELAHHVAITNISSLFNTNPYFKDPEVVILDDAHAAENYVAEKWSVRILHKAEKHEVLHEAMKSVLKPHLTREDYARLAQEEGIAVDYAGVNKLPTPIFASIRDEVAQLLDVHAKDAELEHEWMMLQGHLHACHLYISSQDILIRPLIPPTWAHAPFAKAKQRIYMSATLGESGDLERLVGQKSIHRIQIASYFATKGVGRRFFIFPGLSLDEPQTKQLRANLMKKVERSVILVPSIPAATKVGVEVKAEGLTVFNANNIEASKKPFVKATNAAAIIANRYDGIDFPGKECRLLFIDGLPQAMNSQERFIMSRMGANVIFNERVQTRVLQAVGRCTRALNDYSAVVVTGMDLSDYLIDGRRRKHLHPELQAELHFGIEQCTKVTAQEILQNFDAFYAYGTAWETQADAEIVSLRADMTQTPFPFIEQLRSAVTYEVEYQEHLWAQDYPAAMQSAQKVLGEIKAAELQGYTALWSYLAGSAAWLGAEAGGAGAEALRTKARGHFIDAKKAARMVAWLNALSHFEPTKAAEQKPEDTELTAQLERMEQALAALGTRTEAGYTRREKQILEGLGAKDSKKFEPAQKLLGELLGFEAGKVELPGSPDPWWLIGDLCLVFETHSGAGEDSQLHTDKARQAATHPNWIREYVEPAKNNPEIEILGVLVSPVKEGDMGAVPHLKDFAYWNIEEYRAWAKEALAAIRELRKTFDQPGNLEWRQEAAEVFVQKRLAARTLFNWLKGRPASKFLRPKPVAAPAAVPVAAVEAPATPGSAGAPGSKQ